MQWAGDQRGEDWGHTADLSQVAELGFDLGESDLEAYGPDHLPQHRDARHVLGSVLVWRLSGEKACPPAQEGQVKKPCRCGLE